jgi:hypothetical protein
MKHKKRYADGGTVDEEIVVEGMRPENFDLETLSRARAMGPSMPRGGGRAAAMTPSRDADRRASFLPVARTAGYLGPTYRGEGGERVSIGRGRQGDVGVGASIPFKKGGKVKKMAKGGSTASKRADGCATKGKTKGRMV